MTSLLRGPLMQRASFVNAQVVVETGDIRLPIMPNTTDGWAGRMSGRSDREFTVSDGFSSVIRAFQRRDRIQVPNAECTSCSLSVRVCSNLPLHSPHEDLKTTMIRLD